MARGARSASPALGLRSTGRNQSRRMAGRYKKVTRTLEASGSLGGADSLHRGGEGFGGGVDNGFGGDGGVARRVDAFDALFVDDLPRRVGEGRVELLFT